MSSLNAADAFEGQARSAVAPDHSGTYRSGNQKPAQHPVRAALQVELGGSVFSISHDLARGSCRRGCAFNQRGDGLEQRESAAICFRCRSQHHHDLARRLALSR